MTDGKESIFAGHNYKADYKYKIITGQKADGSSQLKEERMEGDEWEPLLGIGLKILEDWYALYKSKHIKVVSPYEKGFDPTV